MLKFSLILVLSFNLSGIQAQEVISTSGGNASGTGGTVSYTIGQIAYSSQFGDKAIITEGVQQPFEILTDVIDKDKGINLYYSAYPNPTTDYLTLKVENWTKNNLSYQISDINGKLIHNEKVEDSITSISMRNLVPATYFLKISNNKNDLKIFKIVKN